MNELSIIHTANKSIWEIELSDTLSYTVVVYNVSDNIMENLDIVIDIPKETYYVENSFTLNGLPYEYNPHMALHIDRINPKENLLISFEVKLDDVEYPSEVSSCINVNYLKKEFDKSTHYNDGDWVSPKSYIEDSKENSIPFTYKSKTITTPIIHRNIFLQHEIVQKSINLGDIIDCRFIIRNNGSLDIEDVLLDNVSNADLEILRDSIHINTVNLKNINVRNGIYIGKILSKQTILLTFRAKVQRLNVLHSLSSKGVLKFFYRNDSTLHPQIRFIESNEEVVDMCPSISKIINVSKVIEKPYSNPEISQVMDIFNSDINITSERFVDSIKGISIEQNKSNGRNIFIAGNIKGRITYSSDCGLLGTVETKVYTLEYEIPFKTEILVGIEFNEYMKSNITIDYLDANLLSPNSVYVNAVLNIDIVNE